MIITDLPGIYSLSPYSPEERVSRDYLMSGEPDAVIQVIDATNLERNLYLALQVIETGLPVVVALNMADLVEKSGDRIDVSALEKSLGCPVVMISALKNRGVAVSYTHLASLRESQSRLFLKNVFADVDFGTDYRYLYMMAPRWHKESGCAWGSSHVRISI